MGRKFQVGDVVYLKSNVGLYLTVRADSDRGRTGVMWLNYQGELKEYVVPDACLVLVPNDVHIRLDEVHIKMPNPVGCEASIPEGSEAK